MSSHELIDELLRISAELEQTPGNAPEAYLLRDEYHRVHAQLVALGTKMRAETACRHPACVPNNTIHNHARLI